MDCVSSCNITLLIVFLLNEFTNWEMVCRFRENIQSINQSDHCTLPLIDTISSITPPLQNYESELFLLFSPSPHHTSLHRTVTLTDPLPQNCTFCTKNSSPKKWTRSLPKRKLCCMFRSISRFVMHKAVNNETPSSKELIIRFRTHKKKSNWPRRKPAELCH